MKWREEMKNLPTIEKPGPGDLGGEFYPTFKEEIVPILCRLFQNVEEGVCVAGGAFPNSFGEEYLFCY